METDIKNLATEIESLCAILQCYCKANSETIEMQTAITLVNNINNKVEQLYTLINDN